METPAFFSDLNLDQVFSSVTAGREEYDLLSFFSTPLEDVGGITYRQEIFKDLERPELREIIQAFAKNQRSMRQQLKKADKFYYERQKESWFLEAVNTYCDAVNDLADLLFTVEMRSRGLLTIREHLAAYIRSEGFTSLVAETKNLKEMISAISYCIHIKGNMVIVDRCGRQYDYSTEVESIFKKFQQGAKKDYLFKLFDPEEMNHVEAAILDLVADLFTNVFDALREFCEKHRDYLDPTIQTFDREVQFYLAYLEFVENIEAAGLQFNYPQMTSQSKAIHAYEAFDIALANRLVREQSVVVCNDLYLKGPERIFIVSGPNQGGKTTFARMFGQMHYLAKLGCLVPGREAHLFLYDHLFTHFEKEEHIENLRGKLMDEVVRIHDIVQQVTDRSIVIMNESFSSTTLQDALYLGREILQQLIQRDAICVYVTFIDELSVLSEATVSMVGSIIPEEPTLRSYKIVRKPADGQAYALAIANKYGLTYEALRRRIGK